MASRLNSNVPSRTISFAARSSMPKVKLASLEPSETRFAPASASAAGETGLGKHVHRLRNRRAEGAHGFDVGQARRIKNIGAGLLEGLQPPDRVVEVGAAVEKILGPRGKDEIVLQERAASTAAATRSTACENS